MAGIRNASNSGAFAGSARSDCEMRPCLNNLRMVAENKTRLCSLAVKGPITLHYKDLAHYADLVLRDARERRKGWPPLRSKSSQLQWHYTRVFLLIGLFGHRSADADGFQTTTLRLTTLPGQTAETSNPPFFEPPCGHCGFFVFQK